MEKAKHASKKPRNHRISRKILIMIIIMVIILALSIILLFVIPRRPRCDGLIGRWQYTGTEYSGDYIFTFNRDGSGSYLTPSGEYNFNYIDNDDYYSALYTGDEIPSNYPYSISEDGNTLTIIDSLGDEIPYSCK